MTVEKGTIKPEEKQDGLKEINAVEALQRKVDELASELQRQNSQQPASQGGMSNAQFSEFLKATISSVLQADRKEKNYEAGIEEEDIPIDDYEEDGTKFYSPSAGYILSDDKRKGQIIVAPYKRKMFFEHLATRRQGSGRYETTAPISLYVSHSRKITDWIRNHTLYGTMFYETENGTSHDDAQRAKRTAQIMTVVRSYETPELIRACNAFGVAKDPDYNVMRQRLTVAMAKAEIEGEAAISKAQVEKTYKAAQLLGRQQ